jgi:adenylate cyclase
MPAWTTVVARQFAELRRRRVVRTVLGYLVATWLLLQVADVTFAPLGVDELQGKRWLLFVAAAGLLPVAVLAWIFDIRGRRVVRTDPASAAAPAGEPAKAPFSPIASVAILPFVDLSPEHDQAWFCDGLAEEVIDALCCVRGLRVASRTASFRFREGNVDPREIGRQLGVGAILEGSVRKAGAELRVTAQLIDADDGYHLWSEKYDRRLEDVFAIQAEIAKHVAEALRVSLTGPALDRTQRYAPRSVEAYEYYVRGRQMIYGGTMSEAAWKHAPTLFRRAIGIDPDYAQAHAGLADSLLQLLLWRYVTAQDVLPEAIAASARALELAPDLAEAHIAQGHLRSITKDTAGAERSFLRAIELNPESYEAYYYFARHLHAQGELARAARMFLEAFRTRPDDFVALAFAAILLDATGDAVAGEATARRALAGLTHQIELDPENARLRYFASSLHLRLGDPASGRAQAEAALRLRPDDYATLYNVACFYSRAGDHERALDLLERCLSNAGYVEWIEHDPDLAPIREHPRYKQALAKMA